MSGDGTDMLVRILESDGGIKGNLFALDDIYDQIYFIPLIQEVQIKGRLLVKKEENRRLRDCSDKDEAPFSLAFHLH